MLGRAGRPTGSTDFGLIPPAVDDFNGDAQMDLTTVKAGGNIVSVLLGGREKTFGAQNDPPAEQSIPLPSMITSKPAIRDHLKTGQRNQPRTGILFTTPPSF